MQAGQSYSGSLTASELADAKPAAVPFEAIAPAARDQVRCGSFGNGGYSASRPVSAHTPKYVGESLSVAKPRRDHVFCPLMLPGVGVYRWITKCLLIGALFVVSRLQAADSLNASVQFEVTADWGTQFNGQITITNNGSSPIQGWILAFDFTPDILQIWDATLVSQTGSHYVIQSAGWNSQIAASGNVVFGFGGAPGGVTQGPQNITVTAAAARDPTSGRTVLGHRSDQRKRGLGYRI